MTVGIAQYRVVIGLFSSRSCSCLLFHKSHNNRKDLFGIICICGDDVLLALCIILLNFNLIILANDVELNPGPNERSLQHLKLCHLNIQSMKRSSEKVTHIALQLGRRYDIITVSETWLDSTCSDSDYSLEGYHPIYRRDRTAGVGGGVAAWVSSHLFAKRRRDLEVDDIEVLWLEIRAKNNKFLLCTIYRPPNTSSIFWDHLQDMYFNAKTTTTPLILLTGDLNADPLTANGEQFSSFISTNNLSSHINEPTRITTTSESCLDRIVSNFPQLTDSPHVIGPLLRNDHCTIGITLKFRTRKSHTYTRVMWDYRRADFIGLRQYLSGINWDHLCGHFLNIDEAAARWTEVVLDAAKKFIPNKLVTVRSKDKPWYNTNLRKQKRGVDRSHKYAKRQRDAQSWAVFRKLRNAYIQNCRDAQSRYDREQTQKLSECSFSTKECWQLYKTVLGMNSDNCYPALVYNDNVISDDCEKATIFNNIFLQKSFLDDTGKVLPLFEDNNDDPFTPTVDTIPFTLTDVTDQLTLLNPSKAYGPDGIGPRLLKELKSVIGPSLHSLFSCSLQQMKIPLIWKQANVVPIHKKEDKADPSNYRPVSLLNTISKIFEKIVFKYLFNYLRDTMAISNFQSGFLPGCSTTCQLAEIYHKFCDAVSNGKEVRVVFLDISRAFDRVWHAGLLYKLRRAGIKGSLLEWIKNYLSERKQRVCLNGQFSEWGTITAGVPQGSVLGPLLFLIFINDLTDVVRHTQLRLFADDTCLFITVDNRDTDSELINSDLSAIHAWSDQWLVAFSAPKTKSLLISNKSDRQNFPSVVFNNVIVNEVQTHKHLGMTLSYNLKWTSHINEIYDKAMKRLNVIRHFKFKLSRRNLERFYLSFVLPIIEYGDIVWSGASDHDLEKLDKIHIRAMRITSGATERSNINSLYEELGWRTLSERRQIHKMKWFYKIINNLTPSYLNDLIPPSVGERQHYSLRSRENISLFRAQSQTFSKSFFPSAVRDWNALPMEIRECRSLSLFSRQLHRLVHKPLSPPWYSCGERLLNIHHTRIRLGCSMLKSHLCNNLHVIDNPLCDTCHTVEDPFHYFFVCNRYVNQRVHLFEQLYDSAVIPRLSILLFGNKECSDDKNKTIFITVQDYIKNTGRFF